MTQPETKKVLSSLDVEGIVKLFECIKRPDFIHGDNAITEIKSLFEVFPSSNEGTNLKRFQIFKCIIDLLRYGTIPSTMLSELMNLLMSELDAFPTTFLMKLGRFLVAELKRSECGEIKWLEVLPKLCHLLSSRDSIVYNGVDTSGGSLKSKFIKVLFSSDLKHFSIPLASLFYNVTLTNEELDEVVVRLLGFLRTIKYEEIPMFIYHLLPFSNNGMQPKVLNDILNYFMVENEKLFQEGCSEGSSSHVSDGMRIFLQVEGTAILLVRDQCIQDFVLGRQFVDLLRSVEHLPEVAFSPFVFSLALSMVSIQRFEKQVLVIMKNTVLHAVKHKYKTRQAFWIKGLLGEEHNATELIKHVIKNFCQGWNHVSEGLVKFGFLLLDTFGPKPVCGRVAVATKPHFPTVFEECCLLGTMILRNTFKSHRTARSEIFKQILNRIVTKALVPVTHYIDVLAQTAISEPMLLLEVLAKIIQLLDYLPQMPYANALGILKALTPLLKISMPLKDALMLILRKALFHRDIEPRKIAISGYLTILKRINNLGIVALSQSQASICSQSLLSSSSQISDGPANGNAKSKSMCLEIMGILKKTLNQQAELKQLLYEGVYDVVIKNPSLSDIVSELLLTKFELLHSVNDESKPPLDMDSCIVLKNEKSIIDEPIGHLITSIALILQEVQIDDNDSDDFDFEQSPREMLTEIFKKLIERMTATDVEEFGLDKNHDFRDDSSKSRHKDLAMLMLSTYEALMEYTLVQSHGTFNTECCTTIHVLYHKYKKVFDILQVKKPNKSSKTKATPIHLPNTQLTIRFLSIIIDNLFENSDRNEVMNLLREDNNFVKYLLQVTNNSLKLWNDAGKSDNFSQYMEKSFDYICKIARVFLKLYSEGLNSEFASLESTELSSFFIDGLNHIVSYMFTSKESYQQNFLVELAKQIPSAGDDALTKVVKKFQRLTIKVLSNTENDNLLKEVVPLLSIIHCICSNSHSAVLDSVYSWTKQLCKEQVFEDLNIAKKLVTLCLMLSHRHEDCSLFIKEVAFHIHYHMGDVESETTIPGTPTYEVITAQTSPVLIPALLTQVEQILVEADWLLNIMKANVHANAQNLIGNKDVNSSSRRKQEERVCTFICTLIRAVSELVHTAVPGGAISTGIVKTCIHLYKHLTLLCKYFIALYVAGNGYVHPMFEKLVKVSDSQLTTPIYSFINYLEEEEKDSLQGNKKIHADCTNKYARDAKIIPCLVFEIEFYERHLIVLSKKSKVDLMANIKMSTARDFRINIATIEELMKQSEEQQNGEEEVNDTIPMDDEVNNTSMDSVSSSFPSAGHTSKKKRVERKQNND